ncbi:LacI family transcriptional regulator [Mesorhizobium sp. B2-5-13]|uniref:LacI family DNA-binding transcriptional regulator n=1 Tax=unclassified Mesorhizobium TaxID=325217 RepID=UPI00112EE8EF|nr:MULTISPECIES: LacI family DNA-binding transcriptional regulator [unclassified Mesorhizobium]TPJ83355.1 LacI family transcriptional regulator [Mesorhizobium sp. B2-5-13]TPK44396.1 LacI family transcriptional regulator [Mesorhizobium sp. B2-5-5]TPL96903.1 LacI family transcriptional regulator [Mesorhizobium sp. B2-3-11]
MAATIIDVSKRAKVSKSTVSRYLTGRGYVSDSTREIVEAAIRDLGYRPNETARGLQSSRSNIIGGVVTNLTSSYYARLVSGIQQACRFAGKGLLLGSGFGYPQQEERATLDMVGRSCDGLLLNLEFPLSASARDILEKSGIPVVLVGSSEGASAAGSVTLDNTGGAKEAMRVLLRAGHCRIVHIGGIPTHHDTHARVAGVALALAEFGLSLDDITIEYDSFTEEHGYNSVKRLIAQGLDFTAVFAGDDEIAAGAIAALKESGKLIPEDVSVIGFDDSFHARHLAPALTTVRLPIDTVGELAVQMLLEVIEGAPPAATHLVVPAKLIQRNSVANARVA